MKMFPLTSFFQFEYFCACCHFCVCFLLSVTNVRYFLLIVAFIWNVTATCVALLLQGI